MKSILSHYSWQPRNLAATILVSALSIFWVTLSVTPAYAASPGPIPPVHAPKSTQQAPSSAVSSWLAAKNAHRVYSGIKAGKLSGQVAHPYILSDAGVMNQMVVAAAGTPSSFILSYDTYTLNTWEPSDGHSPNYGPGSASTDEKGNTYFDHDFFDLCGPGAVAVALHFWPNIPSTYSTSVIDPAYNTTQSTYWTSPHQRGYMVHIAWQIQWPGWPHPGLMDTAHYYSYGSTNYGLQDALNWEASSEKATTYFYTIGWSDQNTATSFHNDVVFDLADSNVPVVAEVNAAMLPNWNEPGAMVHHIITIIGYNDANGTYTYTDTCALSTNCNANGSNSDGGLKTVSQSVMWNAIKNIPVNRSTDPSGGDGGFIW